MRRLRSLVLAAWVISLGFIGSAAAEGPDTYGTASRSVYLIPSVHFLPVRSSTTYSSGTMSHQRYIMSGDSMRATPNLPNGARVERIRLYGCDSHAIDDVSFNLLRCSLDGNCTVEVSFSTAAAGGTPGCGFFTVDLLNPFNVDNDNEILSVDIRTGTTSATTFSAFKIYYRLRVSPAPAVATFPNDVPTNHPFFQFVEALASAGITGGCGPGSFCPDQPVTRGQMAVFLAAALGLHFPN